VGAAVLPGQRGSGIYTLQEYGARRADVTVVIFANCGYQILHDELAAVGVRDFGKTSAGCSTSRGPNPAG
jgi:acetolactate synthase I/II/III large subunit